MNDILFVLAILWLLCYGIKVETIGLKFFINGFFHTYAMTEELEIVVIIEEKKDE